MQPDKPHNLNFTYKDPNSMCIDMEDYIGTYNCVNCGERVNLFYSSKHDTTMFTSIVEHMNNKCEIYQELGMSKYSLKCTTPEEYLHNLPKLRKQILKEKIIRGL